MFVKLSRVVMIIGVFIALTGPSNSLHAQRNDTMETIFFNGRFVTMDSAGSKADAVAVKNGKFEAVGVTEEIMKLATPSTKLIDLEGKTALPGLIDAHCHPMETIYLKEDWVDCRFPDTKSVKQALGNISAWVKNTPEGKWIFVACVSASQNKFEDKRLPNKAELDSVAPNNPLLLANGAHQAIANSKALEALGVKKGMAKLPRGGSVGLDSEGIPTGALGDVQGDVPDKPSPDELKRYYSGGIEKFWNQNGFTSLMAITPAVALPVLKALAKSGRVPSIRYCVSAWTSANGQDMPEDLSIFKMPSEADPDYYKFVAIKDWVDGENDARTGYMCEPYIGHFDTDPPGGHGSLVTDQQGVNRFARIADEAGVICMLHCSGDKATDIGLTAYEQMIRSRKSSGLFRIEHYGMFQLTENQLQRARNLKSKGLHISTQPMWLLELVKADYENMGAKRAHTGFQFRKMIDAGLEPAASTDMTGIYLGNINPFVAIYATVSRQSDKGLFVPGQAISVEEAVKMWTVWAAKSMGEEKTRGSIEKGKFADITVLSEDIFTAPLERIKDIRPVKTIVGGTIVYEAN